MSIEDRYASNSRSETGFTENYSIFQDNPFRVVNGLPRAIEQEKSKPDIYHGLPEARPFDFDLSNYAKYRCDSSQEDGDAAPDRRRFIESRGFIHRGVENSGIGDGVHDVLFRRVTEIPLGALTGKSGKKTRSRICGLPGRGSVFLARTRQNQVVLWRKAS
jgi:hypothetical protein